MDIIDNIDNKINTIRVAFTVKHIFKTKFAGEYRKNWVSFTIFYYTFLNDIVSAVKPLSREQVSILKIKIRGRTIYI